MNLFRCTPDKSLDRGYLRTCAVYKLLKDGRITSKARAVELCEQRNKGSYKGTVELWLSGPLRHLEVSP